MYYVFSENPFNANYEIVQADTLKQTEGYVRYSSEFIGATEQLDSAVAIAENHKPKTFAAVRFTLKRL